MGAVVSGWGGYCLITARRYDQSTPHHHSMTHPSYAEIAKDWDLWRDYVDPAASMTIEEWQAMSIPDRISLQIETFGPKPESAPTVEQILKQTHVRGHFHEWGVDGGVIRVSRDELRPALECAYDRLDPNWLQFVEI